MRGSRTATNTSHALLTMAEALGLRTERRDDGEIVIYSGVMEEAEPPYYNAQFGPDALEGGLPVARTGKPSE